MLLLVVLLFAGPLSAGGVELRMNRLGPSLSSLPSESRITVRRAVELIRNRQHTAALALLTELSRAHPGNSSVKVVLAYGLLQAGNLVGAFDRARDAEATPDHDGYTCLFLAQVANLIGDSLTCRREIAHVKQIGAFAREVKKLERDLAAKGSVPGGQSSR